MPLLLFASENLRILENFQVMSIAMALFQKKKAMKVCWMMYPGRTDLNFPVYQLNTIPSAVQNGVLSSSPWL